MSFFDEADDPQPAEGLAASRRAARRGGGPRRPPGHGREVQARRLVAVAVIVAIVVVMALVIHSCDVNATNGSLQTYAGAASSLVGRSNRNGARMFGYLTDAHGKSGTTGLQEQLDGVLQEADGQLAAARALHVPGQMDAAQQALLQTLRLRYLAIRAVAAQIQDAAATSTSKHAVAQIAVGMYMLAASDVDYKVLVAPAIVAALHAANLPVGGTSGVPIASGQILNDLGWLQPHNIALRLGAQVPATQANGPCASICGHNLNFVTFGGAELSTATANPLTVTGKPVFALNFHNGGSSNEFSVGCEVWIKGLHDRGRNTYPETVPGGTYNCQVTLPSAPPAGTYTLYARIDAVPGEHNLANNEQSYTVTVS